MILSFLVSNLLPYSGNLHGRPDNKQNHCGTGEECECDELRSRRGLPSACGVMGFASSSFFPSFFDEKKVLQLAIVVFPNKPFKLVVCPIVTASALTCLFFFTNF